MIENTGLVIGIPTLGRPLSLDWAFAFKSLNPPINFNTIFSVIKGVPVAEARNAIAKVALERKAKYVFFLGDDTIPPLHCLKTFIYRLEHDESVGVVGGIYFSKSEPPAPLVFRGNGKGSYWDWKVGEYFECTGLGMDCTMIRTEIFNQVKYPWFHTEESDKFIDGVNNATLWTEDLFFLEKVKNQTSFKIMADASVIPEHVDVYTGKVYSIPTGSLPTRRLGAKTGDKKIIDIGCGPKEIARTFEEGIPVRVDIDERWEPDYRCDVTALPFGDKEFDIVFSSHVLEHFPRDKWESVLVEWLRILKEDGEIRLLLPNIEWAAREIVEGKMNNDILNVLYGAQSSKWDFHYNGLTPNRLRDALKKQGYEIIKLEESGYNMFITAKKDGPEIDRIF